HPSTFAAWSNSNGRPRMNCTIRKVKNASCARNLGTIRGMYVSTQFRLLNKRYCGISTTWCGKSSDANMSANQRLRPLNLIRAKAYAAMEQVSRLPRMQNRTMMNEFLKKVAKEMFEMPRQPFT